MILVGFPWTYNSKEDMEKIKGKWIYLDYLDFFGRLGAETNGEEDIQDAFMDLVVTLEEQGFNIIIDPSDFVLNFHYAGIYCLIPNEQYVNLWIKKCEDLVFNKDAKDEVLEMIDKMKKNYPCIMVKTDTYNANANDVFELIEER